jgi:Adenylate and Guanylate cyclase catalytic domain
VSAEPRPEKSKLGRSANNVVSAEPRPEKSKLGRSANNAVSAEAIDFEAEGLLAGLEGEAREARLALLEGLAQRGVPPEERKRAVAESRLGEQVPIEEIGLVATRLTELANAVAEAPVRLVKLIGDAAMLVSSQPRELVEAALALVEAAEQQGDEFPPLRAGVAFGTALGRGGDWYGRPVNLASRVTRIAGPDSVLVTEEARDAAADGFSYSFAGERRLKGIQGRVRLFRVRRDRDA